MSDALISAVRDRLANGVPVETIRAEAAAAGHDEAAIAAALAAADATTVAAAPAGGSLGFVDALRAGLTFLRTRFDLVWWTIGFTVIGMLLIVGPIMLIEAGAVSENVVIVLPFVGLVFLVIMLLNAIVMFKVALSDNHALSYRDGFTWARQNLFGFLGLGALLFFLGLGSLVPFLVPLLVFQVYAAMTMMAYVGENKRGMAAVSRSISLVSGHWWGLLGLLLGFVLIGLGLGLVLGFTEAVLNDLLPGVGTMVGLLINMILQPLVTVFSVGALAQRYRGLAAVATSTDVPVRRWLWPLAIWGAVSIVVVLGALSYFISALLPSALFNSMHTTGLDSSGDEAAEIAQAMVPLALEADMNDMKEYFAQRGTYEAACAEPAILETESVLATYGLTLLCKELAYVLSLAVEIKPGVYYCVDSEDNSGMYFTKPVTHSGLCE